MKRRKMTELYTSILFLLISSSLVVAQDDASPAPSPSETSSISMVPSSSTDSPTSSPSKSSDSESSNTIVSNTLIISKESKGGDIGNLKEGLALLFPTLNTPSSSGGSAVLKKVCGTTDHPTECVSSVNLIQKGASDPVSVLKTEMEALRQGFKKAISKATEMNDDPSVSVQVKTCLDTCLEIYDSGLYDLDDALEAIASHDLDRLKTVLSASVSDIETCEEAFEEEGLEGDSPMKEYDDELTKLASNNLAIANELLR